jgi:hypothetical protein
MKNNTIHWNRIKKPNQISARNFTSSKGVKYLYVGIVASHSMTKSTQKNQISQANRLTFLHFERSSLRYPSDYKTIEFYQLPPQVPLNFSCFREKSSKKYNVKMTNIWVDFRKTLLTEEKIYTFFDSCYFELMSCICSFYRPKYCNIHMRYSIINENSWSYYLHNSNICFYLALSNQMKTWKK